jgi:selenocysteine lyase/cysteine desulfurase
MDMHDLGVDYYASSSRVACAPTGASILYLRRASQEQLWQTGGRAGTTRSAARP